ncbi:MAG: C40 family peptidase [Chloroflexi bacterium]|nr:C40 family peptidase [Chloroflexota bacterium]
MSTCAISVGIADVYSDPDATSERVTQALLNMSVTAGATFGEWTQVTLSDYEGWIRTDELADPIVKGFCKVGEHCTTPLDLVAVVVVPHTLLYADSMGMEMLDHAYLSTALPLLDTTGAVRLQVALPGERMAWIARDAVSIRRLSAMYPRTPISTITSYARAFVGVPYLWGGTSSQGIDCSGFVQLCYRMGGYILPRDADQQHDALSHSVQREEIQEGDLIFFGRSAITHVAMALNNKEYIHAEGQEYNRVIINSFDPVDSHYDERLSTIVRAIKRVVV